METNGTALPVRKIDRSAWGNDMMAVEIPASDVIAGDWVEGLGIVGAAFVTQNHAGSTVILLCSGENAVTKLWGEQVVVCGAICPECDMHPDDCETYGCTDADGQGPYCEQCNDYH